MASSLPSQNNQCSYDGAVDSISTNVASFHEASPTSLEIINNSISIEPPFNENTVPNRNVSTETHSTFNFKKFKERSNTLKTNLKELIWQDSRGQEVLTLFINNKKLDRSKLSSILIDSIVTSSNPDARYMYNIKLLLF